MVDALAGIGYAVLGILLLVAAFTAVSFTKKLGTHIIDKFVEKCERCKEDKTLDEAVQALNSGRAVDIVIRHKE